ncbi:trypsin-like peptidase domain-containing protein [Kitasatospora sp. NBC_01287]|uniref:trypsin-like peptidase domain-containing protein n=1 Tax=Kitasatospora sp. NBC_01287 TaxID=2903573 RepID=UPI002251235A|nr:trypsin-like peptidase domain-containing protein [Kitasatospora sp. NBC_01287]MCX4749689.1 trypsin-like peptidase domain-containing protein [Kitasatospora sp. NBC_01287]
MTGLRVERVAEVIAGGRRGSGYLVGPGVVLTAAHVVAGVVAGAGAGAGAGVAAAAGAAGVRVRFDADRPGERQFEAEVVFAHAGVDVAVLRFEDAGDRVAPVSYAPVSYGRVGEHDAVLYCSAAGFPRFKLRDDADGQGKYRDLEHVRALCSPLSNRREGTLDLRVPVPGSVWDGMSGAAVFSGGHLIGVVSEHHSGDGPGRLAASRVDRWAERLAPDELATLTALLGAGLTRLPDVVRPAAPPGLRALLHDLTPEHLDDRDAELADLAAFCAGTEPYRRLQGPPWAGKTTLAAWFALHPPPGVVPVCFFVTSRQAGQADSAAFTEQLVRQLAAVAGVEPAPHATPAGRDQERRQLLHDAAAATDGVLLLVVDGLDEDRSSQGSIAASLPERLPANVRVLVTSRPNPGIPQDVPGSHPLRDCPVTSLTATAAARGLEHNARYELTRALDGDSLDREILGLLAAARGALNLADLRELTGREGFLVRARLDGPFGRILRARDGGYLYAHDTLFTAALDAFGPDLDPYRDRLHAWADRYRALGWPSGTPRYLLLTYPPMTIAAGDRTRATALAVDLARHTRLRAVLGSDAPVLAELDQVRALLGDEPAGLAALAAAGDLLARRNSFVPPELPGVLARLGQVHRAEGLARTLPPGLPRAEALTGVAEALATVDPSRTAALVAEAGLVLDTPRGDPWTPSDEEHAQELTTRRAVALATAGLAVEAIALADTLQDAIPELDFGASGDFDDAEVVDVEYRMNDEARMALLAVAEALAPGDRQLAARLLARVREPDDWPYPAEFAPRPAIDYLAALARTAAAVDPEQGARAAAELVAAAESRLAPGAPVTAAATASVQLRDQLPDLARRLARAVWADGRVLTSGGLREHGCLFIEALAGSGLVAEAGEVARRLRKAAYSWLTSSQIGAAYCAAGRPDLANDPFHLPWPETVRYLAGRCEADGLAVAERWIEQLAPGRARLRAHAALTEVAVERDRDAAERLGETVLVEASELAEVSHGWGDDRCLAALVGALAGCGEFGDAERITDAITAPRERGWAVAATAVRRAATDRPRAVALLEAVGYPSADPGVPAFADPGAAGEVLARLGFTEQARALAEQRQQAELPIAAALHEARATAEARALADRWQRRLADKSLDERHNIVHLRLHLNLQLIADLGTVLPDRLPDWLDTLSLLAPGPREQHLHERDTLALLGLLLRERDAGWSHQLFSASSNATPLELLAPDQIAICAIVYDAYPEPTLFEEAVDALLHDGAGLSAVATRLAALPAPALRTPLDPEAGQLAIALACAAIATPPPAPTPARLARAHTLLAAALRTDGWRHALPALAELAPDAVRAVRDVVLAQLEPGGPGR